MYQLDRAEQLLEERAKGLRDALHELDTAYKALVQMDPGTVSVVDAALRLQELAGAAAVQADILDKAYLALNKLVADLEVPKAVLPGGVVVGSAAKRWASY